ncbi:MAG: tetratricopeptide repeat protein, partial [Gammaproteobacteria bacterium]|nr:tetratricopeptide repeat protein [Gammaproteobacteria bacterium]
SYHKYVETSPSNHPMYNSALGRLADLEMIAGDDKLFTEKETQYQKAFASRPNAPTGEQQDAVNYKNAIELYEGVLASSPNDSRNEWVLYKLARAYESVGQLEQATLTLSRLVSQYPNGEYYIEAHFRRGEIAFTLNDFETAEKSLQRVVARGRSTVYYERALYKYAWSQFKQDKYNQALNSFFTLLDTLPVVYDLQEKLDPRALSKVEKDMLDDIFRAVNLCFSYAGGVDFIDDYFSHTRKLRYEYEIFAHIGEYFQEHDRIQDAADVYGLFVKRNPFHPMSSSMQLNRIAAYEKSKFFRSALIAREEFVKEFGIGSQFWARQNSATRSILREQVKQTLDELATFYHARLQKTKKPEAFDAAVYWYEQYVRMFPDDSSAEKVFLLGELYSEKGLYQKAADAYYRSAYEFIGHEHEQESAYAVVDSYNKLLKQNNKPEYHQRLVEVSLKFLEKYPDDKRADATRARLTEELFAMKRYPEAFQQAKILIARPDAKRWVKVTAYIVAGHVAFEGKDYLQAQSHYNSALKLGIRNNRLRFEIEQKVAAAAYKHAEFLKQGGDLAAAAEGFLALQKIAPRSDISVNALYDSATAYFQLQQWSKAIALLEDFRRKYPKNNLSKDATKKLAVAYEKTEQWEKAGDELLKLVELSNDSNFKRDAGWQVAEYYEKAKKSVRAVAAFKHYVRSFPSPLSQNMEGEQKLVELYQQSGQIHKRNYWLKQLVRQYRKHKSKMDDRGKYLVANAAYILASEKLAAYSKVDLTLPLKRSLKAKNRLLKTTVKAYESVVDVGVAEFVTASTYRVGEVYQQFAASIMKSQRPRKLNADELEEYNLLLEEQAYPFEEKAIKIFEANIGRMQDGVYDKWIQQSIEKLAVLQPARYQKQEVLDEVYTALD